MALSIGGQLSVQSVMYEKLLPAPSGGVTLASAVTSQLYSDQAYLILHRPTSELRAATYQETLTRTLAMVRSSWALLSRPGHDPVFATRELTSSNNSSVRGYAKLWATPASHTINVLSVGTPAAQKVITEEYAPNSKATDSGFTQGLDTWRLTINGQTYNMSVDVTGSIKNSELLQAAADQLNALAGAPVTAAVRTDDSNIYLEVTSNTTGTGGSFTLADVTQSFIADSELRTDQTAVPPNTGGISVPARDAATYQIDNGPTRTSVTSRQISLDDDSTVLWLLQATPTPVTVTVSAATADIQTAVEHFVDTWNQSLGSFLANPGELTTPLAAQLSRTAGTIESALRRIGIKRGSDGLMIIDEDALQAAISDNLDSVRSVLAGPQGLAVTAGRIGEQFLTSSSRYVTHPRNYVASAALRWMQYYETRGMLMNTIG